MRYFRMMAVVLGMMFPGWAHAEGSCNFGPLPLVRVNITEKPVRIDHSRSAEALSEMPNDTRVKMGRGPDIVQKNRWSPVGGLANNQIDASATVSFDSETTFLGGEGCLSVTNLTVQITLTPLVYIASDWPEGSCRYKAMLDHEMKHVDEDRAVLKDFKSLLENSFKTMLHEIATQGPMPTAAMYQAQNTTSVRLNQRLQSEMAVLAQMRDQRQQAIDTPSEYQSISMRCQ